MHVKELFNIDGNIALITGGSRGLGLQIAEGLGEMGARLRSLRARLLSWKKHVPTLKKKASRYSPVSTI